MHRYAIVWTIVRLGPIVSRLASIVRDDRGAYPSYESAFAYLVREMDRAAAGKVNA
jgi:hypothetical protein